MMVSYIWSAFVTLSGTRVSTGMGGINPISYTEIKAWSELTHTYLTPRDIEALKKLDSLYIRTLA